MNKKRQFSDQEKRDIIIRLKKAKDLLPTDEQLAIIMGLTRKQVHNIFIKENHE